MRVMLCCVVLRYRSVASEDEEVLMEVFGPTGRRYGQGNVPAAFLVDDFVSALMWLTKNGVDPDDPAPST